jgi:hypothetical protein
VGGGGYYLVMHPLTPQPARPDLAAWLLQESGPVAQANGNIRAHSLHHGHSHGHLSHHHTPLELSRNGHVKRLDTGENMALSEHEMNRQPTQPSPSKASLHNVSTWLSTQQDCEKAGFPATEPKSTNQAGGTNAG